MKNIEDYLLKILLECLTEQENSIKQLDNKVTALQELSYLNNQLLGFVASTLSPTEHKITTANLKMTEEIIYELVKHSAEFEEWGQA